jgi:surface polysaccharide O-acyltransferase-like enzyme
MGSLIYLLGTIALYPWIGFTSMQGIYIFFLPVRYIPQKEVFTTLWFVFIGLVIYLLYKLFQKETNREKYGLILDRISILSMLYLVLDCIGILVVLVRLIS